MCSNEEPAPEHPGAGFLCSFNVKKIDFAGGHGRIGILRMQLMAEEERPVDKKREQKQDIKAALVDTVPVMAGYIFLGIGFGMLLQSKGFGVWWALLISLTVYAGSMQYVAVSLLAGGAGLLYTALTTLTVNARHLFYGISLVEKYKDTGKRKPYLIFALTDETYSLVCGENAGARAADKHRYYFLVSLFDQIYWVTGSVLGALLGEVIPINTQGIDFALTALFITIFVEQWLSAKEHHPALIGVGISVVCLLIFGENFLIPALLLITTVLLLLRKRGEEASHD